MLESIMYSRPTYWVTVSNLETSHYFDFLIYKGIITTSPLLGICKDKMNNVLKASGTVPSHREHSVTGTYNFYNVHWTFSKKRLYSFLPFMAPKHK